MELAQLRKINGLTQKAAAALLSVPYRTYIRYEENDEYKNSYKYEMFLDKLQKIVKVDEEHGILSLERIKTIIIPIFEKHNISFCYLFGSYARGEAKENSDVDLLVDTEITGLDFFKLVEELRTALCKKVDLVRLADLSPSNQLSLAILKEGIKIL